MSFQFYMAEGYTGDDMLKFIKLYGRMSGARRWLKLLFRVIMILGGVFMVLTGVFMVALGRGAGKNTVLVIALLAVGLLWLYYGIFYNRMSARRSRKLMVKNAGSFTITLDEEGLTEQTAKGEARYPYASFTSAVFRTDRWYLFLDKHHAIILPLRAMVSGAPTELEGFLRGHMGDCFTKK